MTQRRLGRAENTLANLSHSRLYRLNSQAVGIEMPGDITFISQNALVYGHSKEIFQNLIFADEQK